MEILSDQHSESFSEHVIPIATSEDVVLTFMGMSCRLYIPMFRFGQNYWHTVYKRYFWQGIHHIGIRSYMASLGIRFWPTLHILCQPMDWVHCDSGHACCAGKKQPCRQCKPLPTLIDDKEPLWCRKKTTQAVQTTPHKLRKRNHHGVKISWLQRQWKPRRKLVCSRRPMSQLGFRAATHVFCPHILGGWLPILVTCMEPDPVPQCVRVCMCMCMCVCVCAVTCIHLSGMWLYYVTACMCRTWSFVKVCVYVFTCVCMCTQTCWMAYRKGRGSNRRAIFNNGHQSSAIVFSTKRFSME